MWFSFLSHNRQSSRSNERRRAYGSRRQKITFRPAVAALEERRLPSTLTVLNNLDSGSGSLRAEIAAAKSGGDTIVFDPSLDGQTITLTSGELQVTKNLTIQGPGAGLLAITTGGGTGVFLVDAPGNLNLSGLTLEGCNNSYAGGAIGNDVGGTMTVSGCNITGNTSQLNGGAIYNGGTMTVSDCNITGNTSQAEGGAIANYQGRLTVSGCTITGNYAPQGGGIWSYGYGGGGVTVTHGSTVCGNTAAYGEDDLYIYAGEYKVSKDSDVCVIFA
jgi:hypothetical protein